MAVEMGERESSAGTKRVAERGREEGSATERMLAHLLKSPAPISASIMLLSC